MLIIMAVVGLSLLLLFFGFLTATVSEGYINACRPTAPVRGGEGSIVFGTRVGSGGSVKFDKTLACEEGYAVSRLEIYRALDGDGVAGVSVFCAKTGVSGSCDDDQYDGGSVRTELLAPTAEPAVLVASRQQAGSWKVVFPVDRKREDPAQDKDAWTGFKIVDAVDGETSLGAAIRFAPWCSGDAALTRAPFHVREVRMSAARAVRVFYDEWFVRGFQFIYNLPQGLS